MTLKRRFPKYLAEGIGTFCLVFAGCGAIMVDRLTGGQLTHVGVSLVFGLVVLAMIYAIGHISGAHMNPAVTLGFFSAGRLAGREIAPYGAFQLMGAVAAGFVLRFVFAGTGISPGATVPVGPWERSFILEILLTAILMFVVMSVATDHRAEGPMAGVAVGALIAVEALVGGPVSGASMNPARSFGPALASGNFAFHWIYWVAPILGSLAGAAAYKIVRCPAADRSSGTGCC